MTPEDMHVAVEDLAVQAEADITPSWIRAPPPSLMPTTGQPVFIARSITLTIFSPVHLAEGAAEDGDVVAENADRPAVDRAVAGDARRRRTAGCGPGRSRRRGGGRARPVSTNEPGSSSAAIRSRAVFLPLAC